MASGLDIQSLFVACENGEMDIIDPMLSAMSGREDINLVRESRPYSLLEAAINTNPWSIDVVTKLLVYQRCPECKNPNFANVDQEFENWNAIDHALDLEPFQPHLASLLLDCSKLGINRVDDVNQNYLWSASTLEAVQFLVQNGIDINHVSNDNVTGLEIFMNPKTVLYLQQHGAKPYEDM